MMARMATTTTTDIHAVLRSSSVPHVLEVLSVLRVQRRERKQLNDLVVGSEPPSSVLSAFVACTTQNAGWLACCAVRFWFWEFTEIQELLCIVAGLAYEFFGLFFLSDSILKRFAV